MNMNKIKAILHNKVLAEIAKEHHPEYIVVDQFEPEKSYYRHLQEYPNPVKGITFITKAEDKCFSVAVSSLISRYIFIKEMNKLGNRYDIFLPKGANYYVEDVGIKISSKIRTRYLKKYCQIKFQQYREDFKRDTKIKFVPLLFINKITKYFKNSFYTLFK